MAHLAITVYKSAARDATNTPVPIPEVPALAEDSVEITADQQLSQPWPEGARFIAVKAGAACYLAFGAEPEAREPYHPVDAGELRWYGVRPGDRLAVIEQ